MAKGNKWGRPAKINEQRLAAAKKVIADENNIVCLTDEDLLDEINDSLKPEHQVSQTTFEEYKAWKKLKDAEKQALLDEFSGLYKKALRKQKKNLLNKMVKDFDKRQRYAWIVERKFDEWNIRSIGVQKHEVTGKDGKPLFESVKITVVK